MTFDDDLRAIQALNKHDVDAVLAGDMGAIASQWTDDFVVLSSRATIRGKDANTALIARSADQMKAFEPVDYTVEFDEITVAGEYAFEWGTYRGSVRPRAGGEATPYQGKLLRILQRQPDGSWKMHRTMMTNDPG
jgi:ketosteroid isomerase-like protein